MKEGDVVLTPLPQADGVTKARPVVVLREMPRFGDLLVCGVTSQLHQRVAEFDEIIAQGDPDFGPSGLMSESLIRLGYLGLLPLSRAAGSIGAISPERHRRLLRTLSDYLVDGTP